MKADFGHLLSEFPLSGLNELTVAYYKDINMILSSILLRILCEFVPPFVCLCFIFLLSLQNAPLLITTVLLPTGRVCK